MAQAPAPAKSSRSLALDIFRGMTVCFMIIVNTPGTEEFVFAPLRHAQWHGFTPTDLVFPSFLFAVGNAMSFAMKKFETMGEGAVLWKIFKRTLIIFGIGFLIYWFPFFQEQDGHWSLSPFSHTRIMGVLERIALCYCIASLMVFYMEEKAVYTFAGIFLLGYWVALWLFPVPGNDPYSMTGNAGYRLDVWAMGQNHMYHGEGVAFDPEGILSTIPAIVNVLAGYFTGVYVSRKGKTDEGLARLLLWGTGLIFAALVWNMVFPINKKLWTSSYVFLTIGIDLVLLSFLIYIIEFKEKTRWTAFFAVFGKNPLFIYILSELLIVTLTLIPAGGQGENAVEWVNTRFFQALLPGRLGSLFFALVYMFICWLIGKWLDVKKIYVRV